MLSTNISEEMLGLQDVIIKNCKSDDKNCEIELELPRKSCKCPHCGAMTDKVHDYRRQTVGDLPSFGKKVVLILRKRRYRCSCGKRFFETNTFLPKYQRRTQRTTVSMLNRLSEVCSYTSVAHEYNLSVNSVIRLFNNIRFPKPDKLPEVLGIDEFKGNSGKEKYHCIITDIENGKVIDILHTRYQHDLCDYFKSFNRSNVKYFVSDMYSTYSEIAKTYFPKAVYVIDKYHWIRQALWAFETVRKEVQKKFSKQHRIYFKHSRFLLMKRRNKLTADEWQQVSNMLYVSPSLSTAYFLKEQLYHIFELTNLGNH
ncbi:MAG TPA: ISL3 family transposase [Bacillota bacterium]|nr:ISL3 family transposase [Bacillota bacterium]